MKRTVIDVTPEMHQDLGLLAKIAGTTIRREVEQAITAHLEKRWNNEPIKSALAKIQKRWT